MAHQARRHVLVMDDDPSILALLRSLLEEEGDRVSASPTLLGLDAVKRLAPDLILLDLVFGGQEQGLGLLQRLRSDGATARIPVIVCSASPRTIRHLSDGHLGEGVGLIVKPFDLDELLAEVGSLAAWGAEQAQDRVAAPRRHEPATAYHDRPAGVGPRLASPSSPPVDRTTWPPDGRDDPLPFHR